MNSMGLLVLGQTPINRLVVSGFLRSLTKPKPTQGRTEMKTRTINTVRKVVIMSQKPKATRYAELGYHRIDEGI